MRIVRDHPPLFDEIDRAFRVRGQAVVFAWGDTVFNPTGVTLGPEIMAHEAVHGERQGHDVVGWWRRYIEDARFRLDEEIPAHRAEYRVRLAAATCRNERRACLKMTARRLTNPIYGFRGLITTPAARAALAMEV